jgi:glucose-6-phosphate isomerase
MNLNKLKPDTRHLQDIRDVVYDKKWLKTAPNWELYYMYRDWAESEKDYMKIIQHDLRYDFTILKPKRLGKEFNKTLGHDHPLVPGTSITYPELYEVIDGKAIFLLQDSREDAIRDIFAIKANKGDKIIILPNYEHLIINIGKKELKTSNWVARSFSSNIYKPFKLRHGFSYYALKGLFKIKWAKNPLYKSIPKLRFEKPNKFCNQFYIFPNQPIYKLLENPSKLDFLKNPQKYIWD